MEGDTDLGSTADPTFNFDENVGIWRASWAVGLAVISIVAGLFTLSMLLRRPWRPTLMFIIVLVLSDWFKAVWQFTYSSYWLRTRNTHPQMHSSWCQIEGFFYAWSIEMSDFTLFAMLSYVVLGVALRNKSSSTVTKSLANLGYFLWIAIPPIIAALGFVNGNRYTNQGTTCYLPVRPFWYRLGLSWVPRYAMLFISSLAVAWLFLYIKAKHRSFMILLKRPDSSTSTEQLRGPTARTSTQLTLPKREDVIPGADFAELPVSFKSQRSPHMPQLSTNNLIAVEDLKEQSTPNTMDTIAEDSLNSSSEEMLRRLRRLWVYPLIYFLYWIFPFVYHAMSYKIHFVLHPVPWLAGLSSSFVSLHCTFMSIAVWAFERPDHSSPPEQGSTTVWRHILGSMKWAAAGDCFTQEVSKEQRRSNNFAHQRLAIEMKERQEQARWSALSSPSGTRRQTLDTIT